MKKSIELHRDVGVQAIFPKYARIQENFSRNHIWIRELVEIGNNKLVHSSCTVCKAPLKS